MNDLIADNAMNNPIAFSEEKRKTPYGKLYNRSLFLRFIRIHTAYNFSTKYFNTRQSFSNQLGMYMYTHILVSLLTQRKKQGKKPRFIATLILQRFCFFMQNTRKSNVN